MITFATILFLIGGIIYISGGVWLLVVAFKESILWFLACLFIPVLGAIAFLVTHFPKAWPPMAVLLAGGALWAIGAAMGGDPMPGTGPLP